jgi:hypothetical protein
MSSLPDRCRIPPRRAIAISEPARDTAPLNPDAVAANRGSTDVTAGGSFTLTTGQINDDPIRFGVSGAMVNGALEGFLRSAAVELPGGLRINLVSPTVIEESWSAFGPYFPGQKPIPSAEAALGYVKSVEGSRRGASTASGLLEISET